MNKWGFKKFLNTSSACMLIQIKLRYVLLFFGTICCGTVPHGIQVFTQPSPPRNPHDGSHWQLGTTHVCSWHLKYKWAMSETCDYQPMSHKITYARPYALLTRPQFWLTRRAWTYHDLRRAYADRFDSKRIGNAYARSVFRSCADAVIQEAVGNANLTWTPWLRTKSTGCQSWAMVYWDMVCLRTAYAQLTRSLREFTTPNL